MAKKPAIMFYPGDWKKDTSVTGLPLAARMLWFEMLLLMNEAPRRGYLQHPNGQPISIEHLARASGSTPKEVKTLMPLIEAAGTFSRDGDFIFNRRMVRETEIGKSRSEAGRSGAESRWQIHGKRDGKSYSNTHSEIDSKDDGTNISSAIPRVRAAEAEIANEIANGLAAGSAEGAALKELYQDFMALWTRPCDVCGMAFPLKKANQGCQEWMRLVENGTITDLSILTVFVGLTAYRASDQWHKNRGEWVPAVPKFLGASQVGEPAAPLWNDRPTPFLHPDEPEKSRY